MPTIAKDPQLKSLYSEPDNLVLISMDQVETRKEGNESFVVYYINLCRRYSEFVRFRDVLVQENSGVRIPELPPKHIFSNRMDHNVIEERRKGLEAFMRNVATHPLLRGGPSSRLIISFLQDQ